MIGYLQNMDTGTAGIAITALFVAMALAFFIKRFVLGQRREKYLRTLMAKTEGRTAAATSVLVDAQKRSGQKSLRNDLRPFDLVNWWSIRRDLRAAGLPAFPLLVPLAAAAASYAVARLVIAAPIYPIWAQAVAVAPFMYYFVRKGVLGIFLDNRRMKLLVQLVGFIESVQRAVSVGTAPDDAVAESIRETEEPLRDHLSAIRELLDIGYDFIDALNIASDRINMAEFDIFAASLTAQANIGGSIGTVLRDVIDIARSRLDLHRKVATMTAEGQFNAMLLGSLPIGLTMYLRTVQPDYFRVLWTHPVGSLLFFATLFFSVFGAWVAMRIAKIDI